MTQFPACFDPTLTQFLKVQMIPVARLGGFRLPARVRRPLTEAGARESSGQGQRGPRLARESLTSPTKGNGGRLGPELQSWVRNVILPNLLDAYCELEAPARPVEALASSREVLQSHERDEEHESTEGTCG